MPFPEPIFRFSASSDAAADAEISASAAPESVVDRVRSFFTVFSDPSCNRRLFALAFGQMLCSVATLIHDTYLPVYMQDVLGLSNTKVSLVHDEFVISDSTLSHDCVGLLAQAAVDYGALPLG